MPGSSYSFPYVSRLQATIFLRQRSMASAAPLYSICSSYDMTFLQRDTHASA